MSKRLDYRGVQGAHLVGSVPFASAGEVFASAAEILGAHLHRIPDGETGDRKNWIAWQMPLFADCPALEWDTDAVGYTRATKKSLRLREEADAIQFGNLGYADVAIASYRTFSELRSAGRIPAHTRFQVSLPTPVAPVHLWVRVDDQPQVEGAYEAAILVELERILENIPADELAVQWDTATEFGVLEGCFPSYFESPLVNVLERLERLGNAVPEPVELGYHLCYGDAGHQHFVEPKDMSLLVDVANGVAARIERTLNWVHMPVPKNRDDAAYYAPAAALRLSADTKVYLGLIHSDGEAAAKRRISAAQQFIPEFGVATECGFGRRPSDSIPALLEQHRNVSAALD